MVFARPGTAFAIREAVVIKEVHVEQKEVAARRPGAYL